MTQITKQAYYMYVHMIGGVLHMFTEENKKKIKDCACRNLRMTTRVTTLYYDKAFQPIGLKSTQFALLADIASRESSTIGELSEILLMDQTTVTRSIEVLRKNGFIEVRAAEDDARKRCISITKSGTDKLREAIPLWQEAQNKIVQSIGEEKYNDFLDTLALIQSFV
ncbi:hypothetical protein CFB3_33920 [Clostridium folliculivorans]|uniref:HTH marR-type domain-containing protein n=2 Tax=Clostridium folliculivorans TaxID=2886038 RepID=A0A9W6DAU4_9CLOT|nr:hypothetical protein CFOLD11_20130 [Clostridium folliculivorans]GKU31285.1 hypothetical protein CFB3_33920 [Clostridium folliculivorans]